MPDDTILPVIADEAGEELARLVALTDNPYVPGGDKKYTEFTAKRKAAFITAVAAGASATKAAELAGVVKSTAYYQRRVDPQFAEAWEYAKEQQVDGLEDALRGLAVDSKNIAAIIWSLKNLAPEKWKDKHDFHVENGPPQVRLPAGAAEDIVRYMANRYRPAFESGNLEDVPEGMRRILPKYYEEHPDWADDQYKGRHRLPSGVQPTEDESP